jgi:hypothetical protein
MISFLNNILILGILFVGATRFDDIANFVDLGIEAPSCDEAGQLGVEQGGGDAEGSGHRRQHHTANWRRNSAERRGRTQ